MRQLAEALCVLCAATADATERAPVEVVLLPEQAEYTIGEGVPISWTIRATGDAAELEFREDLLRNFYGSFEVTNPQGTLLRRLTDRGFRVSQEPRWIAIPCSRDVDLAEIYAEPYQAAFPHTFDQKGRYKITYGGHTAVRKTGSPDVIWEGDLTSQSLTVNLAAPSDRDLLSAYGVIVAPDASTMARVRAIDKIRYAERRPKGAIRALETALRHPDGDVRIRATRALGAIGEPDALEAIARLLQHERDPFVRSEAIGALERFDADEARRLLVSEIRARRERSYRAAVVVLAKVGDQSCVEVLEDVAETDEAGWVRERAKESIEKIRERGRATGPSAVPVTGTSPAATRPEGSPNRQSERAGVARGHGKETRATGQPSSGTAAPPAPQKGASVPRSAGGASRANCAIACAAGLAVAVAAAWLLLRRRSGG